MAEVSTSPMQGSRDLRIDFIRGCVMFVLVIAHIEIFSLYNLVAWERVGLVSGAGGFVLLSGIVVGMVYGARSRKLGLGPAAQAMLDRALQLYRVNVFVIVSVALMRTFTIADVTEVTSFTDRATGTTYPLLTAPEAPLMNHVADILLLRSGPHQIQILGLYVFLLFLSPVALWLMNMKRTEIVLLASWLMYIYYQAFPTTLTTAQFENAFPFLAWQILYFHGLAVGFHRERVLAFMESGRGKILFAAAFVVFAALFFLAQNTPNEFIPAWARLYLLDPHTFDAIRVEWFDKNPLRLGRVVNWAALLIVSWAALTRFWRPVHRAAGWFFIPIGQATLYVFIVHVYVVLLVSNVVPFGFSVPPTNILMNTIVHTISLAVLWLMVRYQVLFGWIPR